MSNLVRPNDLTLQERYELELFCDGPITPQMVGDKVNARRTPTIAEQIEALRADIRFRRSMAEDCEQAIIELIQRRDEAKTDHSRDGLNGCIARRQSELEFHNNIAADKSAQIHALESAKFSQAAE